MDTCRSKMPNRTTSRPPLTLSRLSKSSAKAALPLHARFEFVLLLLLLLTTTRSLEVKISLRWFILSLNTNMPSCLSPRLILFITSLADMSELNVPSLVSLAIGFGFPMKTAFFCSSQKDTQQISRIILLTASFSAYSSFPDPISDIVVVKVATLLLSISSSLMKW